MIAPHPRLQVVAASQAVRVRVRFIRRRITIACRLSCLAVRVSVRVSGVLLTCVALGEEEVVAAQSKDLAWLGPP